MARSKEEILAAFAATPLTTDNPCTNCQVRRSAMQSNFTPSQLANYRYSCSRCKEIRFDLLLQYWQEQKKRPALPPGRGRFCTIPAGVQNKIMALHSDGLSQQKIAEKITKDSGYEITRRQVQGVIKNNAEKPSCSPPKDDFDDDDDDDWDDII